TGGTTVIEDSAKSTVHRDVSARRPLSVGWISVCLSRHIGVPDFCLADQQKEEVATYGYFLRSAYPVAPAYVVYEEAHVGQQFYDVTSDKEGVDAFIARLNALWLDSSLGQR